jgi:transposase
LKLNCCGKAHGVDCVRIVQVMQPFARQRARLPQIPGVEDGTAASILAAIGTDMTVFRSARRLAAWAGVCPANHESAGRAKRRGTRKGNVFLKATLMTAAMGATRTKGTDLRDKFHRLKARLGAKKAALAIAHKILVAVFHRLARTVGFHELGADDLDRRHKHRIARRLIRRLDALGYTVMLQPRPAA